MTHKPPKPTTKPPTAPDIGYYPMMHPYPGLVQATCCGALVTWDRQALAWVTPIFGQAHHCDRRS
jgi:hypothetical protein